MREAVTFECQAGWTDKGDPSRYRLKEIQEQAEIMEQMLEAYPGIDSLIDKVVGDNPDAMLNQVRNAHIAACGTSYNAGQIAWYWLESLAAIPCQVEIASEYQCQKIVVPDSKILATISQSNGTADTPDRASPNELHGLYQLDNGNLPGGSLTLESEYCLVTNAGSEIGAAFTKAVISQLLPLLLLVLRLAQQQQLPAPESSKVFDGLRNFSRLIVEALELESSMYCFSEGANNILRIVVKGRIQTQRKFLIFMLKSSRRL